MKENNLQTHTIADWKAKGEVPDVLFWVGCAGSFDDRAKKITRAMAALLHAAGVRFAVLGTEEGCTGDPARRAGNEFLFQMQAQNNISVLNGYDVKEIVTTCPHCFNTLRNEYPELGGHYTVTHHTVFLQKLIDDGALKVPTEGLNGQQITFHDSCYLGRANGIYEAPRKVLGSLNVDLKEMGRCKSAGLCCGAGGGQMFKEPEKGDKDINIERIEEALETGADTVAVGCPFCMTMMSDGVKNKEKESSVQVKDVAEILAEAMGLLNT